MRTSTLLIVYGLIVVGIFSRLLPHAPNVTPLVAVALFSGAYLPRRWAIVVPLGAVMISDVFLGLDAQLVFNWFAFALVACGGWWLRERRSMPRLGCLALGSSTLFFLVSNFGVWVVGRLYTLDVAGLINCYIAGVPFYRNMLLGDLAYTAAIFGLFALVQRWLTAPHLCSTSTT
jgi:hypothetical protein